VSKCKHSFERFSSEFEEIRGLRNYCDHYQLSGKQIETFYCRHCLEQRLVITSKRFWKIYEGNHVEPCWEIIEPQPTTPPSAEAKERDK
jgi:hypothetical protein